MELQGKVKFLGELQTLGSSGFRKRELVIITDEQYPQTILFEFIQDKTDLLNGLKLNQEVKVEFDVRGREWVNPQGETKYFNSLNGWRITKVESKLQEAAKIDEAFEPIGSIDDDLPF